MRGVVPNERVRDNFGQCAAGSRATFPITPRHGVCVISTGHDVGVDEILTGAELRLGPGRRTVVVVVVVLVVVVVAGADGAVGE